MEAVGILFALFISVVFTVDFAHTIREINKDRAMLKRSRLKTRTGGFGV